MESEFVIGIDIGGTKIAAGLVDSAGIIVARAKQPSPVKEGPGGVLKTVSAVIREVLESAGASAEGLEGIGVGVPGVVDAKKGVVLTAPNLSFSNAPVADELKKEFGVKVAVGNDVNLGVLGEKWLGAAKGADSVVGVVPGTGIGGGVILDGKLCDFRMAGGELGHMIMDVNGPRCSCGNRGCLEALASRWAIERDIRQAIKKGKKSAITEIAGDDLSQIKSKMLRKALEAKDKVVTRIMRRVSKTLGMACVSLRHIFNPELIVLGGGVVEACGGFMMPIIRKTVAADPFFADISSCEVVNARLGDDSIILGAVALVRQNVAEKSEGETSLPVIQSTRFGEVTIGDKTYTKDLYIYPDGTIKKRKKKLAKELYGTSHQLGPKELKKLCKKKPEIIIVGSGQQGALSLTKKGEAFLKKEGVKYKVLSTPDAVRSYNKEKRRKALLIHVTC